MSTQKRVLKRQPKRKFHNCLICSHAKFDEQWGEYKCLVNCVQVYDPDAKNDCKKFRKKTTKS